MHVIMTLSLIYFIGRLIFILKQSQDDATPVCSHPSRWRSSGGPSARAGGAGGGGSPPPSPPGGGPSAQRGAHRRDGGLIPAAAAHRARSGAPVCGSQPLGSPSQEPRVRPFIPVQPPPCACPLISMTTPSQSAARTGTTKTLALLPQVCPCVGMRSLNCQHVQRFMESFWILLELLIHVSLYIVT